MSLYTSYNKSQETRNDYELSYHPAYQPDLNLVKLVRLVHAKSDLHIIVVDDGSDADKKVIFDKLEGLATVLTHEHNQGKGQSLKTAYDTS